MHSRYELRWRCRGNGWFFVRTKMEGEKLKRSREQQSKMGGEGEERMGVTSRHEMADVRS